ncbi:alpha-actinin-3-like [Bolinopsis microptera]|uniref:alpha-actinin-3-like n=1 Tax=Bolinopsis microptera TaxID=2820187 RepID=UPI00307A943F
MVEKNERPVRHSETHPVSTHNVSTLEERQEESGGSRRKLTRQVTSKLLQLKSSREEVQKRTFQKWVNMYLKPRGTHVTDLFTDLKDGVLLLQLLEQLSSEKLGRSRCVDEKLRALENVGMALTFLHSKGLKTVNIDATNITSGDSTLTLGMLWIIILKFQIHGMSNGDPNTNPATSDSPCRVLGGKGRSLIEEVMHEIKDIRHLNTGSTLQQQLRGWLQETLGTTEQFNFSTSWNNGILLCRLLHAYRPDKVVMASVSKMSPVERVQHALNVAKSCFSVEPLLMPHDVATSIPDERVVLVYLSVLKSVLLGKHTARQRAAHFMELQERSRVMMGELEEAQEHCVEEMAGEWRKLRDTLHSEQPPQGLNEVFLVSSRQLASQYDKSNKAAQKKLHTYATELQELDKFEKEIKRLKHLASYVHSYRDSLAKVVSFTLFVTTLVFT